jgi:hypothetical protein
MLLRPIVSSITMSTISISPGRKNHLFNLPPELRGQIFKLVTAEPHPLISGVVDSGNRSAISPALPDAAATSRQMYDELAAAFYSVNIFRFRIPSQQPTGPLPIRRWLDATNRTPRHAAIVRNQVRHVGMVSSLQFGDMVLDVECCQKNRVVVRCGNSGAGTASICLCPVQRLVDDYNGPNHDRNPRKQFVDLLCELEQYLVSQEIKDRQRRATCCDLMPCDPVFERNLMNVMNWA